MLELNEITSFRITIYTLYCEEYLKVAVRDKKKRDHIKMYACIIISAQ